MSLIQTLNDFYTSDTDQLFLPNVSGKNRYYLHKYSKLLGLTVTTTTNQDVVVEKTQSGSQGVLDEHIKCPECKEKIRHPLMYDKHINYGRCDNCNKKYPYHYLYELGGIEGLGQYCHDCCISFGCCFKKHEWNMCDIGCYICEHDEYCTHYDHSLEELYKCDLCKDYL